MNNRVSRSESKKNTTAFRPVIMVYAAAVNLLAAVMLKIPVPARNFFFNASVFLIVAFTTWRWTNKHFRNLLEGDQVVTVYVILFLVLLLASIDRKILIREIVWSRLFWIGWFLCFVLIFITSFPNIVDKDYHVWSTLSLFYFPALFIVWQARDDFDTLFQAIAWSTVVCALFFYVLSVPGQLIFDKGLFPDAFLGLVGNPNANGMVATGFFAAGFYLAFNDERTNLWAQLTMAIAIALSFESVCRTAELAILMMALMGWLFFMKMNRGRIGAAFVKTLVSIALLLAFTIPLCLMLKAVMSLDIYAYAASVHSIISPETYEELNTLSSGRLELWRFFTQDINLFGHGAKDTYNYPDFYHWAHNNLIDVLYISGLPAAIGYLILLLCSIVFTVRCAFGRVLNRPEYLFVVVSFMGYFIEAMLEITIYPMTTGIVFMAFMGLAMVSGKKASENRS